MEKRHLNQNDVDPTLPPIDTDLPQEDSTLPASEAELPQNGSADTSIRDFGAYELLVEIARGGMGVVYKARQRKLNRIVALKMILSGELASQEEIRRFHVEAEAAANLSHIGIVPIYESGEYQGQHYFSMGFVDGISLADRVRDGPLEAKLAAELTLKVAEAIAYAHQAGVIHRDLKPANVLLDKQGEPRVTDFGLAKQICTDNNLTSSGAVMGTPSYMPPEQAAGQLDLVGPPADVYALGAILYCLLTGRPPFQAANQLETLMQVLEKDPVTVRTLNPSAPIDLETIALKCLEKSPEKRYRSANDLVAELQRFVRGEPIIARPTGRISKGLRWATRHPAIATSIITVAILLAVTIIGGMAIIRQQWTILNIQVEAENARLDSLFEDLLTADLAVLPRLIDQLRDSTDARELIQSRIESVAADSQSYNRILLARFAIGDATWLELEQLIPTASPEYIRAVREVVSKTPESVDTPSIWRKLAENNADAEDPTVTLPWAAILSLTDPNSPRWPAISKRLSHELVHVNSLHRAIWLPALKPVAPPITEGLTDLFQNPESTTTQRMIAAELICDLAGDHTELLVNLLVDAEPEAFEVLIDTVANNRPVAIHELRQIVQQLEPSPPSKPDISNSLPLSPETIDLLHMYGGLAEHHFSLCQSLPLARLDELSSQLGAAGYQATRIRPYWTPEGPMVAGIWDRDDVQHEYRTGLTAAQLQQMNRKFVDQGLTPIDIAGYLESSPVESGNSTLERYAAVWKKAPENSGSADIVAGLTSEQFLSRWNDAPGTCASIHLFKSYPHPPGLSAELANLDRYSAIFRPGKNFWNHFGVNIETTQGLRGTDDWTDISVGQFTPLLTFQREGELLVERLKRWNAQNPASRNQHDRELGLAYLSIQDFVAAEEMLTSAIQQRQSAPSISFDTSNDLSFLIRVRAVVRAALGKQKDVLPDLDLAAAKIADDRESSLWYAIAHGLLGNEKELQAQLRKINASSEDGLLHPSRFQWTAQASAAASFGFAKIDPRKQEDYRKLALQSLLRIRLHDPTADAVFSLDVHNNISNLWLQQIPEYQHYLQETSINHQYCCVRNPASESESAVVLGASSEDAAQQFQDLVAAGYSPASLSSAWVSGAQVTSAVWQRPRRSEESIDLFQQPRSRAAIALLRLDDLTSWTKLTYSTTDRRAISYWIRWNHTYSVPLQQLVKCLDDPQRSIESNAAILQSIGEYELSQLSDEQAHELGQKLANAISSPNAYLHASAQWLINRWELPGLQPMQSLSTHGEIDAPAGHVSWYQNSTNTEFVRLATGSFMAGTNYRRDSSTTGPAESPSWINISRPLAIATTCVTKAQYQDFFQEMMTGQHPDLIPNFTSTATYAEFSSGFMNRVVLTEDSPVTAISFESACLYCNWLSKREGLPQEQWVYEFAPDSLQLVSIDIDRGGYRLPTTFEWEYAARGGTTTRRFFGYADDLLPDYGWYVENSNNRTWPVGLKKPNPFGLFDVYGNVWEFCIGGKRGGGCYDGGAFWMRSSQPQGDGVHDGTGFRLAKTLSKQLFGNN